MGHDCSCMSTPWGRTAISEGEQTQTIELPEAEAIRRAQQGDAAGFQVLKFQPFMSLKCCRFVP